MLKRIKAAYQAFKNPDSITKDFSARKCSITFDLVEIDKDVALHLDNNNATLEEIGFLIYYILSERAASECAQVFLEYSLGSSKDAQKLQIALQYAEELLRRDNDFMERKLDEIKDVPIIKPSEWQG